VKGKPLKPGAYQTNAQGLLVPLLFFLLLPPPLAKQP